MFAFRTQFDDIPSVDLECKDPSLTKQCFKDDCDVNQILEFHMQGGDLPPDPGIFMDCCDAPSFLQAQNMVLNARYAFDSLDAKIRARFDNSPEKLLSFLDDASNVDEAVRLGILEYAAVSPEANSVGSKPTESQPTSSPT